MKQEKSAKDAAFDRERIKFRSQIKTLENNVKNMETKIEELQMELHQKDNKIEELEEWVERLLEYTELSKEELEDMKARNTERRETEERMKNISSVFGILSGVYGRY